MLNQVLEATLAFMVALLALSISVIVRARPTPSSTTMNSGHSLTGEPVGAGNSLTPVNLASNGSGPTLWAANPAGGLPAPGPESHRSGLLGRRYEARHVRGRTPAPRLRGPSGPPWGPAAPPPAGRPQQGSERWT